MVEPTRRYQRATLDAATLAANKILVDYETDPQATAAYNVLRTRLLQRFKLHEWASVAVTGTQPGEGKSLTAVNLAIALAREVKTHVYLVDMDLKRPSIAKHLGMQFDKGLSDYLAGNAELDEIVYDPGISRLAVIPNSVVNASSSELMGSARVDQLVSYLNGDRPRRVIIYDLPPLLASDDVLTFAPLADGILYVVTAGITDVNALQVARRVLADMNLIGVVLNRSSAANKIGYGYY